MLNSKAFFSEVMLFTGYSDSFSALNSIADIKNYCYYATKIRNILSQHYRNIILIWLPAHTNISDNNRADQAAKQANQGPVICAENLNL